MKPDEDAAEAEPTDSPVVFDEVGRQLGLHIDLLRHHLQDTPLFAPIFEAQSNDTDDRSAYSGMYS